MNKNLVNVYVKSLDDNKWHLIYKDIPETQAARIWSAGFSVGENRISIETEEDRAIRAMNRKALGIKGA